MSEEMKPCPFCGKAAGEFIRGNRRSRARKDKDKAIAAWNALVAQNRCTPPEDAK